MTQSDLTPKTIFRHTWRGSCDPGNFNKSIRLRHETFSVGCFLVKQSPKGQVKTSAVKVRIIGYTSHPEQVYEKAREVCELLDAKLYAGPKTIKLKPAQVASC